MKRDIILGISIGLGIAMIFMSIQLMNYSPDLIRIFPMIDGWI